MLDVLSSIGLKTMVVASKQQPGMMMWVEATMVVMVAMVACPEEPYNVQHNTLLTVPMLTSPSVATMPMVTAKLVRCNPKVR